MISDTGYGFAAVMLDNVFVKKTSKVLFILVGNDSDFVIPRLDGNSRKQLLMLLRN